MSKDKQNQEVTLSQATRDELLHQLSKDDDVIKVMIQLKKSDKPKKDKEEQEVTLSRQEFMRAYDKSLNLSYHGWDGIVKAFSSKDAELLYQSLQGQTMPLVFNDLTDFSAKVKN